MAVEIRDALENRVTSATDTVALALSSSSLSGYAPTLASSGLATFTGLGVHHANSGYTITASSGSLDSDVSDAFNITHGAATKLVLTQNVASSYTADQDIEPEVKIEDQYDNIVDTGAASTATVTLTLTNANGAVLIGGSDAAANGVAQFTANVRKVGSGYGLNVGSSGLSGTSTGSFAITHAAAAKLAFTVQPTSHTADNAFGATVEVQDTYGNTVIDGTGADASRRHAEWSHRSPDRDDDGFGCGRRCDVYQPHHSPRRHGVLVDGVERRSDQ